MRRLFDSARFTTDLRVCPACRQPFVAPREIMAVHDDGQLLVELACANCGWSSIEVHDAMKMVTLERALDRDSAQIEAAAEALAVTLELERIDRFAHALHHDHVLPEDF
jgi:ribosomal protein S27AE